MLKKTLLNKSKINTKLVLCVVLMLFLLALCWGVLFEKNAFAQTQNEEQIKEQLQDNVDKNLNDIDFGDLIDFENQFDGNMIYGGSVVDLIKDIIAGKYNGGFKETVDLLIKTLGVSVKGLLPMLITVVAVAIVFSIMQSLSSGFLSKPTTEIIHFVCYSAIVVMLMTQISFLIAGAVKAVANMSKFMKAIFPIMLTLVTALGGASTTAVYSPMMATLAVGVSSIINVIVLPCFVATMALSVVGALSKGVQLEKLTKFFKSLGEIVIGVVFGLFTTFVTANGISGAMMDNISIKSAKFALASYVPILGGYLSEGFDLAMASVTLVKNALGIGGVIIMLSIILAPVAKIVIFSLGLKLVSGIIEPIGNKRISEIVYQISTNLTLLVITLLGMAFMFFIMIILIMLTCNLGV